MADNIIKSQLCEDDIKVFLVENDGQFAALSMDGETVGGVWREIGLIDRVNCKDRATAEKRYDAMVKWYND